MEDRNQTKYDKAMVNRLARATGHLKMVKQMVEDGRDCSEVLIQLAAGIGEQRFGRIGLVHAMTPIETPGT